MTLSRMQSRLNSKQYNTIYESIMWKTMTVSFAVLGFTFECSPVTGAPVVWFHKNKKKDLLCELTAIIQLITKFISPPSIFHHSFCTFEQTCHVIIYSSKLLCLSVYLQLVTCCVFLFRQISMFRTYLCNIFNLLWYMIDYCTVVFLFKN